MSCSIHVINSDKPTHRIDDSIQCHICGCRIIESCIKWFNWDFFHDMDPDNLFIDILSKYMAFTRIKRYHELNLDFDADQKRYIQKMNIKIRYWMKHPLETVEPINIDDIYMPEYYEPITCARFLEPSYWAKYNDSSSESIEGSDSESEDNVRFLGSSSSEDSYSDD